MKRFDFFQFWVKSILIAFLSLIGNLAYSQYINVDTNSYTAAQLVTKFIGTNNASCISVSNITITGKDFKNGNISYGYFDKGTSNFNIDEGIILSTGNAKSAEGPKGGIQTQNSGDPFFDASWLGDTDNDLSDAIRQINIYNTTSLEFDFTTSLSNRISFDYMFASEEYYKDNCTYSDGFAFLIKEANDPLARYENIAVVPGTNAIVSVPNINSSLGCYNNVDYFGGFNTNPNVPINFGGQTKVMTARANVKPGVKYHIKLIVGDQGSDRGLYDSAVFLKSGSFTGNIDLLPNLASNDAAIICNDTKVKIEPKNPGDISDPLATYDWYRDGVQLFGEHLPYLETNIPATYKMLVTLSSQCTLEANVKLITPPSAVFSTSPIEICDSNFTDNYTRKLSDFNQLVVANYDSSIFDVYYYNNPSGSGTPLPDDYTFVNNVETLYVKANAYKCDSGLPKPVMFYKGAQLNMNYPQQQLTPPVFDVCDDLLTGSKIKNLQDYVDFMTNEKGVSATFYENEAQAKNGGSSTVNTSPEFSLSNSAKTYFIRIEKFSANSCPNYSSFKLIFKQPKKSTTIQDTVICKNSLINLDAGTGLDVATGLRFSSYKWYRKSDPATMISDKRESGNLSAGDYIVELGFNGCVYKQSVKISEPQDLIINNVLIEGNKITILASNGIPSYQYFLDGNLQSSNIIENLSKGQHTVVVKDQCGSVLQTFYIINEKNVITPNGDGYNDIIDYSDLMTKLEPRFEVYDRNGVLVFKGAIENQYKWDGKFRGRPLPSASYWYILEWNESGNLNRVQKTGWILLKNRNSD